MGNLQEEADLNQTIQISARRFEESPFIQRTNTSNMVRGVYAGRYFPMKIDEDPQEKYWLNPMAGRRRRCPRKCSGP